MFERVEDVRLSLLEEWNIRGIALDLDNTIVPWHTSALTPMVRAWVAGLHAAAIRMCLLTNNYSRQAADVAAELRMPIVRNAFKPLPAGFRRSLEHLGVPPGAALCIGDQLFTDVLGAKVTGMRAILVRPVSNREFPTTKVLRALERPVLARLRRSESADA